MNVDFPDPFGPVIAYRRPGRNVVVTSSKRTRAPKRMEMSLTEIKIEGNCQGFAIAPISGNRAQCVITIIPRWPLWGSSVAAADCQSANGRSKTEPRPAGSVKCAARTAKLPGTNRAALRFARSSLRGLPRTQNKNIVHAPRRSRPGFQTSIPSFRIPS